MQITAVTCIKDEAPYLVDWVAHHLACGFNHVLICSHDCADGTDRLIDALAVSGQVTHLPFTPAAELSIQWQAMKLADRHALVKSSDWVMFFDCDEYLDRPVTDMIEHAGDADAIALQWRLFGSSAQVDWNDTPVPIRFTRAAPQDIHLPLAYFVKSLFRPKAFQKMGVHRPKSRKSETPRWVTSDGKPLPAQWAGNDNRINLFGLITPSDRPNLNHYSIRSAMEFLIKTQRGLPNRDKAIDLAYWVERNWNDSDAPTIQKMRPATDQVLNRLMTLPNVKALHDGGIAHHRAKLDDLLHDSDQLRFLWNLILMGDSTPPTLDAMQRHLARLQSAKG